MFAIIKTGGKQYTVNIGDTLAVEKIDGKSGSNFKITDILAISDGKKTKFGTPFISDATVDVKVIDQIRDKKIIIFKKNRRKGYRRKQGHRQDLTLLKINDIKADGFSSTKLVDKKKKSTNLKPEKNKPTQKKTQNKTKKEEKKTKDLKTSETKV